MMPIPAESHVAVVQRGLPMRKIELIEASYARLEPRLRALALAFHEEILQVRPALGAILSREDAEQRQVATSLLGFVVANLRSPSRLVTLLERLGERGFLHDLTTEEVDAIGKALLGVLRDHEGPRWTLETGHAWALAFAWTVAALRYGAARRHMARAG